MYCSRCTHNQAEPSHPNPNQANHCHSSLVDSWSKLADLGMRGDEERFWQHFANTGQNWPQPRVKVGPKGFQRPPPGIGRAGQTHANQGLAIVYQWWCFVMLCHPIHAVQRMHHLAKMPMKPFEFLHWLMEQSMRLKSFAKFTTSQFNKNNPTFLLPWYSYTSASVLIKHIILFFIDCKKWLDSWQDFTSDICHIPELSNPVISFLN